MTGWKRFRVKHFSDGFVLLFNRISLHTTPIFSDHKSCSLRAWTTSCHLASASLSLGRENLGQDQLPMRKGLSISISTLKVAYTHPRARPHFLSFLLYNLRSNSSTLFPKLESYAGGIEARTLSNMAPQGIAAQAIYPISDPPYVQFPSRRSVVHSTGGMVASTQPLGSEAGQRILKMGGNAAVSNANIPAEIS